MRVPILTGALRGTWWLLMSRGQPGRVLTGTYEVPHTRLFTSVVAPGATVLDVGAHTGYYTLLASRLVGDSGSVHAFEPNPRNCEYLRRHVAINRAANVTVEESAVSDSVGVARFAAGRGSGTGRLVAEGGFAVRTVTLDRYCETRDLRPAVIKVDVEGAEDRTLEGATSILADVRPLVMLSTHGTEVHRRCVSILASHGYRLEAITGTDVTTTSELLARTPRRPTRSKPA